MGVLDEWLLEVSKGTEGQSTKPVYYHSLCDTEVKNQVKALEGCKEFNKKLDLMMLLKKIKKIVYTDRSDNLQMNHNKEMVHISFMDLWKEKFQDIQDFRDQYMSVQKVCDELELTFDRRCQGADKRAIGGCTRPCGGRTSHDIFCTSLTGRDFWQIHQRKRKWHTSEKDPFPKTVADMCRVLARCKNGHKHNDFSDANDGFTFATTDGPASKNKGKNIKIKCY